MNELGKALCVLCDKELVYGARGVITILVTKIIKYTIVITYK